MDRWIRNIMILSCLFCIPVSSMPATCSEHMPTPSQTSIPILEPGSTHEPGGEEHIVILEKNMPIPPRVADVLRRLELDENHPDVRHVFNNSAFRGFAASMKSHCLDLLGNMSDVSIVERATAIRRSDSTYDTRPNAPWGLQRISTSSSVSGNTQAMDYTYSYHNTALGSGADVYIIDTGIYTQHNIFGGRAQMLWSFDGDMTDSDGHGTHVAGTAAGAILGVASNANIFGVKALDADGGGWSSNVVAAIDYVVQNHDARKSQPSTTFLGSVMSMSLSSSGPVGAINAAVEAAIGAGIHACVAAGNDNADACSTSPASSGGIHGRAITVGAIDISARRASFSNSGECVDVYAPGVDVISSWIGAPNMVNILSGTSMATPHVTGIVAYAMANTTLADDPTLMKDWVRMAALQASDGMLLANNGVQGGADGQGVLGLEEVVVKRGFAVPEMRTVIGRGSSRRVERAFSGLYSSPTICPGGSGLGTWLCNAKRAVRYLTSVLGEGSLAI